MVNNWSKILRIKIGYSEYSLYGFLNQPLEDFWKDYVCWRHIKKYGHIFKEVCDKIGLENTPRDWGGYKQGVPMIVYNTYDNEFLIRTNVCYEEGIVKSSLTYVNAKKTNSDELIKMVTNTLADYKKCQCKLKEIEIEKEFNPYKLIYEQLKEEYGLYENGLDYAHAKDLNMFMIHFNGKALLVPDKLEVTCYGYGDLYSHAFQNVLKFGPLTYIEELKTFEDYKKHLDKLIHEYKVSTIQMLSKYN